MAKNAVVCGAGGFIGSHLVKKLKSEGYWVRGVDLKYPEYAPTLADEFLILDLRDEKNCQMALTGNFDEIYQLAADMGGMGFISTAECDILRNNTLINNNLIHYATSLKIPRYFFSSSVCIYRNMKPGEPEISEADAYPAMPDNEYGWEKLYAERVCLTYARNKGIKVRIARFQNCYGPEGTWDGGREKAPAAICRKVALSSSGGTIEVWGDGTAIRSYIYIEDMIDGIYRLMQSDILDPVNIGYPHFVSVNELVRTVSKVAGKEIKIIYIDGPVGVFARNFSNNRIYSTGWKPKFDLESGIKLTYPWIEQQVKTHHQTKK